MARDILGGFGPGSSQPQRGGVGCGGVLPGDEKDVMNYQPPQGPKGIMEDKSPGLHGRNAGNTNRPTSVDGHSGSPGLHGVVRSNSGSQGRY